MDFKSLAITGGSCFASDKLVDMVLPIKKDSSKTSIFLGQGAKGAVARTIDDISTNYLNSGTIIPSQWNLKGIAISAGANIGAMYLVPKIMPFEQGSLTYYAVMFGGQYLGKMLENKFFPSGVQILPAQPSTPVVNRIL
jgi:hypothetical protein